MTDSPTVRLTFLGAAQTVTGSKFLVEVEDKKILFDCGLFQGRKKLRKRNWDEPPFDPSQLSAVVLTHAHIDHTGYVPLIVKRGYKGPIYCTPATKELLGLLLPDSGHLQEEEAEYANRRGYTTHHPAEALYTEADARQALKQLKTIERDQTTKILNDIAVTPLCAGHILGSTSLTVDIGPKRITFSGDIGRYDTPILPPPKAVDLGDVLLCESTYGNRFHADVDVKAELTRVIREAKERNGPLIIPAFAIGRTQNIIYHIAELERDGAIPALPLYIDSPMAIDATMIYRSYRHDFDEEAAELIRAKKNPLLSERISFCRDRDDSIALNTLTGPRIVISASGMVTGGRILHHMNNWLGKEETTVLFVGYQAHGTRGSVIKSGAKTVKLFGRHIPIRAQIESISGLSAHGDRDELLRWLKSSNGSPTLTKVIHGEPEPSLAFAETLSTQLGWKASPAKYREQIEF